MDLDCLIFYVSISGTSVSRLAPSATSSLGSDESYDSRCYRRGHREVIKFIFKYVNVDLPGRFTHKFQSVFQSFGVFLLATGLTVTH